ncbi:MAG: hypothetical protein HFG20_00885 [Anaerotruncus sp.]|nr:hypothetical protein [Anaerotruncus sp.]
MNRKQKLSQRVLALVLASATLFTSALPAFAMDDLSGMDTLPDIVDVDGEILDIGGVDFVVTPNESIEPDAEDSAAEPQEPELAGPPAAEQDTPLEEEAEEPFLVEDREETVNEPESEKSSGLDPPEDFSFAAQLEGGSASGMRRERASSGSTTIYIQTDSSIQYVYPFNGGNLQPAYIFSTADGQAAFCIEPARWNSVNGDLATGSQSFGSLSQSQQSKIARAIAAAGNNTSNHAYYVACQAIIWEIAYGQSHGSGSVYQAVIAANSAKLSAPYQDILGRMQQGGEHPSFMSPDPQNPTIHEMEENADGSYSIELTNSNSTASLHAGDFKSRAPLSFSVSSNKLKVTSPSTPDADSFVEWHSNEQSGSGLIFWSSNRQAKATLVGDSIPRDGLHGIRGNLQRALRCGRGCAARRQGARAGLPFHLQIRRQDQPAVGGRNLQD